MKNNRHAFDWQASKVRGCEAVGQWIEPIRNHLWHCAEQCDGDEQTLRVGKKYNKCCDIPDKCTVIIFCIPAVISSPNFLFQIYLIEKQKLYLKTWYQHVSLSLLLV